MERHEHTLFAHDEGNAGDRGCTEWQQLLLSGTKILPPFNQSDCLSGMGVALPDAASAKVSPFSIPRSTTYQKADKFTSKLPLHSYSLIPVLSFFPYL